MKIHPALLLLLLAFSTACSSTRVLDSENVRKSGIEPETVLSRMPDYSRSLQAVSGRGRAIVSEPGNTERATVQFSSNRRKSLVKIKNSIGIEGGVILSDGDSLLVYNKVDKIAQKVSVMDDPITSVGHMASVNILHMMNFTVGKEQIESVLASESSYILAMKNGGEVYVDKNSHNVLQVDQPRSAGTPYSRIIYEAYAEINGYILPRRVTIFSSDATTRVVLLIQSLSVNPGDLNFQVDLPEDVKFMTP